MLRVARVLAVAGLAVGSLPALPAQQASLTTAQKQVADVLTTMFAAADTDDTAKFDSLLTPGFYMYDNGKRFDGDAIMALIKSAHAAGMKYEWTVKEPDVHIAGKTAWIAYVNRGSFTDAKGVRQDITWLESADFVRQHGAWKLVFFQSERAAAPQQ